MRKLITILIGLFLTISLSGQLMFPAVVASQDVVAGYPAVLTNADSTKGWYVAATVNITTDGQDSVTVWNDLSGSGNHLLAADGTGACPWYNPGTDSISFDGVKNSLYKAIAALDQPCIIYAVFRPNTYTDADVLFGSENGSSAKIYQSSSGRLRLYSGVTLTSAENIITYGQWYIIRYKVNGASSSLQIDAVAAAEGDAGSNDANGFGIADDGTAGSTNAHMAVKAVVLSVATGTNTETEIYNYLNGL